MLSYKCRLQGGTYDGKMIEFDVDHTPSAIMFGRERYTRMVKKTDPEGPWEPANLTVTFVHRNNEL